MVKWGDNPRDFDTILATWPVYKPRLQRWFMQELVDHGERPPTWRDRRIPTENQHVRMDVYADREAAMNAADLVNPSLANALAARDIEDVEKRSLQLKVSKALQAKERLQEEEDMMLVEAVRRHGSTPRQDPAEIKLDRAAEPYRENLTAQLGEMPYLKVALVGREEDRLRPSVLLLKPDGSWTKVNRTNDKVATFAERAKIANGFGLNASDHWAQTKAKIRQLLLPRANQLLQLASVQRLLAEALARGEKVLVCNGVVFWYEEDGGLGWMVKSTTSTKESESATLWKEGTILSQNHGRLVILPYIKENGEQVRGHTKNGPHDGPAKPRHPDHFVEIPFVQLKGDLMIGLLGELPYE